MSVPQRKIRVGSRKSELALIQTRYVISQLKLRYSTIEFEIVTMSTLGDKVLDIPLPKIGEKSLFTKELETALADGSVDFVVHSLKDLPTTLPAGMAIGAVLKREDPRDALVLQKDLKNLDLHSLPAESVIGTSSLRRTAQLAKKYPHLRVEDIRGNLNTRLRKLDELGKFSAIILASAGLTRMGWDARITKVLDNHEFLYAVGQGALAIECRANDNDIIDLLSPLYDYETGIRVIAERTFLKTLGGGCSAPVATSSEIVHVDGTKHKLKMVGAVWSLDGSEEVKESMEIDIDLNKTDVIKVCPYKDKCNNVCVSILKANEDCESPDSNGNECELPRKKQKVDDTTIKNDIPLDLLKSDPHEHCPVSIPVGADFMGKCPYLELAKTKPHLKISETNGNTLDVTKCPYFNAATEKNKASTSNTIPDEDNSSSTFCGLVPHKQLLLNVQKQTEVLGLNLANQLIKNGALDIMAKAQAHIRGA